MSLQERYNDYHRALQYITQLMNIPEFARVIKFAMWTPHPTSHIIKQVFADTQLLCDSCLWPCNSRIQKNLEGGIYPAHLMISASPKEWKWHHRKGNMRLFKTMNSIRMPIALCRDLLSVPGARNQKARRLFTTIHIRSIISCEYQDYWYRIFKEDYGVNQFILELDWVV